MKTILLAAATLATAIPLTAQAEDLLTGDTRLACEATLCLSSGTRPNECNPALRRYFSITHKKMGDTISARHDFLKQCPASNDEGMPGLVRAIANGAGSGSQNAIGTGVLGGMISATVLGIFFVPVFFVAIRLFFKRKRAEAEVSAPD